MKNIFIILFVFCSLNVHAAVEPIAEIVEPDAKDFPAEKFAKVAVVQWAPHGFAPLSDDPKVSEEWKQQNRLTFETYIREAAAKGAKLVATPEFGVVGYPHIPDAPPEDDNFQTPEQVAPYAEELDGTNVHFFSRLAKELKIYIHFGMAERDGKVFHNTVVALDPEGKVVAKYRKIHLYQIENQYLVPGKEIATYESEFGKIGIVICSDVYSGHPMDKYRAEGVNALVLSTSWAQYNTGWGNFVNGAKWVKAHLLAANQIYFPDSGVINPDGSVQSHIRQSEGLAYGYLPLISPKKVSAKKR